MWPARRQPRGRQPSACRRRVRRDRRGGHARLPDVRDLGAATRSTTDFVPFLCALTAALCAKPVLAEEWGGCTVPGGGPVADVGVGRPRRAASTQFMAGEDALAEHVDDRAPEARRRRRHRSAAVVLRRLRRAPVGPAAVRSGAVPSTNATSGSSAPTARSSRMPRWCAGSRPRVRTVQSPRRTVELDVSADEYYADPLGHARRLYDVFLEAVGRRSVTAARLDSAARLSADDPPCSSPDPARRRRARAGRVVVQRRNDVSVEPLSPLGDRHRPARATGSRADQPTVADDRRLDHVHVDGPVASRSVGHRARRAGDRCPGRPADHGRRDMASRIPAPTSSSSSPTATHPTCG